MYFFHYFNFLIELFKVKTQYEDHFVKSYESNFSIVIEMVQSNHIQYITNQVLQLFESFLQYICTLQYIVTCFIFSQIYSLII